MPQPTHNIPPVWMSHAEATMAGLPTVISVENDLVFLRNLLPKNYKIKANYKGDRLEGYYCTSTDGKGISDATDEWVPIFQAIKRFFRDRFSEVFHTTCSDHLRFTIYLKQ